MIRNPDSEHGEQDHPQGMKSNESVHHAGRERSQLGAGEQVLDHHREVARGHGALVDLC